MSTPPGPQDPYQNQPGGDQPTGGDQGSQPPAYGSQPPAYGSQPPAYGSQPPAYGDQSGYGQTPAYGQGPAAAGGYGYSAGGRESNSLGIWSLVLGIASFVCSLGFLTGIPAIILGNKSKKAAAEGRADNGTLGTVGMVLGWIATILSIIGIIVVVALVANGDWAEVMESYNEGYQAGIESGS